MKSILNEKEYQDFIVTELLSLHGYIERTDRDFDRRFAIDPGMLFEFLRETQSETLEALAKIYKDDLEETILATINAEATKPKGGILSVLKYGIELSNMTLRLMYRRPETSFNPELAAKYAANKFSVAKEVWSAQDEKERIDLVACLNGLPIMTFELKCNAAGQSYEDAIWQYRKQRDPKSRLFLFKAGALVNFAMDLHEVYMATCLAGEDTFFLPFNMGAGEGVNTGKGNPNPKDDFATSYMWRDVLAKDSIIELISKFIFVQTSEKVDETTGRKRYKETLIFPRYHQRRVVRRLLEDVRENGSSRNYLIQHSAGSGKTNSIAWLAHRLASLHDASDEVVFNNVIIVTDRVVVDRQLQKAVMGLEHKSGLIRVMDDRATSADLAKALMGNTKIVATTIQKFPYIVDTVRDLQSKRFAVIIDEAHSSTSGKDMSAITQALGSGAHTDVDVEDMLADELRRNGKQANVSVFAFTATPKPTTLQLFGTQTPKGLWEAFDVYSMKQAIEEGFILDVLTNYTTYDTFYHLNKAIEEDPRCKTSDAKRQIARFISLHETNIAQRIEIIIEHFRTSVAGELSGTAKAMVITGSRQEAVKYRQAFEDYVTRKGYRDIHALVAFSGKVTLDDDDREYTEAGMNGFPEARLTSEFDKDDNRVLLVANKYQTRFDQPKLCAMYVLKALRGVSAVQTLSRLNRICPPFDKRTFVLDFVNSYEDIKNSFAPYYTTTMLSNSVTADGIYELEAKIDGYLVLDPDDIEKTNDLIYAGQPTAREQKRIVYYLQRAKQAIERLPIEEQLELQGLMKSFVRFYEFLIQATSFDDTELHRKYNFITYLLKFFSVRHPGGGFDLKGKIEATNFVQKKSAEFAEPKLVAKPVVKLPIAGALGLSDDKETQLSKIIAEINARTGQDFDADVVTKSLLQIRDLLLKSDVLKTSARNNSEQDFEFTYYDAIDDALLAGLGQNQEFFTMLLNDDATKQELMGIFASSIYNDLRENQ